MLDGILGFISRVDGVLWGPWTMLFIAGVSVYLTLRSRFFQFRKFRLILSGTLGRIFEKVQVQRSSRP